MAFFFFFGFHYLCLLSVTLFSVTEKMVVPWVKNRETILLYSHATHKMQYGEKSTSRDVLAFQCRFLKKKRTFITMLFRLNKRNENVRVFNTFISFIGLAYLFFVVFNNVSNKNLVFLRVYFNPGV